MYPKTINISGDEYVLRQMTEADRNAITGLAQRLTERDLYFMRRDITQSEAIEEWIEDIDKNRAQSLLVEAGSQVIAYGTLYYNQFFWNRHLGEIRVVVNTPYRNRGIGSRITRELMGVARELRLEKVMMYMAVEDKGARSMVEDLGFRAEAILSDWVKARDNSTHDLLIMSIALAEAS